MTKRMTTAIALCVTLLLGGCLLLLTGCGGQESEFEKYGIKVNMEIGKASDYLTTGYSDQTKVTTGKAEIKSSQVVASDANHQAKDGYEWQLVTMTITFSDDAAWNYGYRYYYRVDNYYTLALGQSDIYNETQGGSTFTVKYKDKEYTCLAKAEAATDGWTTDTQGKHSRVTTINFAAQVPEGYDGVVFGLMNAGLTDAMKYTAADDAVKNKKAQVGDAKPLNEYYSEQNFLFFRVRS